MKETRFDSGKDIRRIISYMIMDRSVCARISSKWTLEGLFNSNFENLVGRWCVDYFKKYGKPPKNDIIPIFEEWASNRGSGERETIKLVENLLRVVSDTYEQERMKETSAEYIIDLAGPIFNKLKLKNLLLAMEEDLEANDLATAGRRLRELSYVELGPGSLLDIGKDDQAWEDAFDDSNTKPLVTYPGILGMFIGGELSRDSFVVFMASSKRGKSWWLHDLGFRAVRQRRRVLYFEAGDLSKNQLLRRLGRRALGHPKPGRSGEFKIPIKFANKEEWPEYRMDWFEEVTSVECRMAWDKAQRGNKNFKLSCHPNNSLTVSHIASVIGDLAREEWIPDVVIIDYADILAPPARVEDKREQINENWKYLRRISQEFHCCVVTATQADAESYTKKVLGRKNFSDDRRKHDHVTAMIALNSTDDEKANGITRLNFLDRRDSEFTEGQQLWVVGNLDLGRPIIISTY